MWQYFYAACFGCYLLVTLPLAHWFLSSWWWRRYVPPKRRSLHEPHGVTSQTTKFLKKNSFRTPGEETEYIYLVLQFVNSWIMNKSRVFWESNKIGTLLVPLSFSTFIYAANPLLGAQAQFLAKYKLHLKFKVWYFVVPSYWRSLYLLANEGA
jgi:hypothetical protein